MVPSAYRATGTAGGAGTIALNAGNGQSAAAGSGRSPVAPSVVKVTDAGEAWFGDIAVTFAVASGGGSITGGTATTNPLPGIAAGGSRGRPDAGGRQYPARATRRGPSGSPVHFTATGGRAADPPGTTTATVPAGTAGQITVIAVILSGTSMATPVSSGGATVAA